MLSGMLWKRAQGQEEAAPQCKAPRPQQMPGKFGQLDTAWYNCKNMAQHTGEESL